MNGLRKIRYVKPNVSLRSTTIGTSHGHVDGVITGLKRASRMQQRELINCGQRRLKMESFKEKDNGNAERKETKKASRFAKEAARERAEFERIRSRLTGTSAKDFTDIEDWRD
jgi:hypothetical protein